MNNLSVVRGQVIRVDVPYLDATRTVRRPALVVGNPNVMLDVIIAAITSRIRDPLPPTHYVVDSNHPDWNQSGLRLHSVVRCDRLFTVHPDQLHRTLGNFTAATMSDINSRLRLALGLKSRADSFRGNSKELRSQNKTRNKIVAFSAIALNFAVL